MKVAIIGSGPGGMITAMVLANHDIHVSVFEKGNATPQQEIEPFSAKEMDTKYKNQGVAVAFGSPTIAYVEGECVGGGSEVNAGLYHRTPKTVFESWNIQTFDYSTLEQHMELCEKLVNVCYAPFDAPLASQKLQDGADALGWQCAEVPRWYRYTSNTDKGIYSGVRQSMTEAVKPKIDSKYLTIKSGCEVVKIREHQQKNVSVFYMRDGQKKSEIFDFVFCSAGAINTPFLLQKSGFKNRHIGKNLRLHPSVKMTALFNESVNSVYSGVPAHQVKEFAPTFSFGCSISTLPHLGVGLLSNRVHYDDLKANWQNMATYYTMVSDGVGCVKKYPFIRHPIVSFKLGPEGVKNLVLGMKKLSELLFSAGARTLYPSIQGVKNIQSPSDWGDIEKNLKKVSLGTMTVHLMGSCRMGTTYANSVVNEAGKLHGFECIYIADASIIPTALGVNPQGTIMALCHRNAEAFVKTAGRKA